MEPRDGLTVLYTFSAIFAVSACWLWFRFLNLREAQAGNGFAPSMRGLSEAVTATALALGIAGAGYLISHFI